MMWKKRGCLAKVKRFLLPFGVTLSFLVIFMPLFVQKKLPLALQRDVPSFPETVSVMQQTVSVENNRESQPKAVMDRLTFDQPDVLSAMAWVVQIQAFQARTEATALMQQLRDQHFEAFLQARNGIWVVNVGPEVGKKNVRELTVRLAEKGYEGICKHYHPVGGETDGV
jgi:cell division septation protein DedD